MATGLAVLRRRADFLAVAKSGRKCVTPGFILQFARSAAEPPSIRFGLTATIKSVGNAVRRNRARRRLRALAQEILPNAAQPGHDYVLIARAETLSRAYAHLKEDLLLALRKTGTGREKAA